MELKIEWIAGQCPVQSEGTIDDQPYFFRARGNRWTFTVNDGKWGYSEEYGDALFGAGWMTEDEAQVFIKKAAGIYEHDHKE